MKNKRLLTPSEAVEELGISIRTLIRWDQAGTLRTVRTVGNQRRIPVEEIFRLRRQGEPQAPRCAIYARVSSARQEQDGNLARQTQRLKEAAQARGYKVVAVITELASALNERRQGMKQLLALVGEQAVDVVLIEYPDRLVRFGCSYLEQAFQWQHVRLEVLDQPQSQEPTAELIRDMLAIVTVFAGRLYGQRARGLRKRVQTAIQQCEQELEGRDGTGQADHQTAP
jgi:excisionase family DNA binding protein